jgi:enoyl-CoA hydratase/carnithine racemase
MNNRNIASEISNRVLRITVNRPEKRNALSVATAREIINELNAIRDGVQVRAVVLTGAGDRVFASGADLDELPDAMSCAENARAFDKEFDALYAAIAGCPVPVIARVNGHAIGGGCLLALACDFAISTSASRFGFPVSRIGLMLSEREHMLITRSLSVAYAKFLIFTGTRISAEEALVHGMVQDVVAPEDLDTRIDGITSAIVAGAPLANTAAKSILDGMQLERPLEEIMNRGYTTVYASADLREGLSAAREKRTPVFNGL